MSTAIQIVSDERLGLPSASNLPSLFACAGKREMEEIAESQSVRVDDSNRDAAKGTLLHSANESGDVSDLDEDDADHVARIRSMEESLVDAWLAETGHTIEDCTIYREVRLWAYGFSAKVDTLVVNFKAKRGFLSDAKTGRKKVASVTNWQLRAGAVAATWSHGLEHVRTAIIQPMCESQPVCDYDKAHLESARDHIIERLEYIKQPGLPRTPGTHCEFCKGRAICPEAKKSMSAIIGAQSLNWDMVLPQEKLKLEVAARMAIDCATLIRDQIRADLRADPSSIPGLVLKPDQHPVSIKDPAAVALKCCDKATVGFEMSRDVILDFLSVAKLSKAKALEIIRERTGLSKADSERFLLVDCADAVKESTRSGSVSVVED